ncbi:MAG: SbcC/MukB-like Walker B domain-containing protein, partial [Rhodanobacter sp.]
ARSIRDYCLGVFRSGEEGRKRRTATTYISLVFRDQQSGVPLTAGIALGASADETEHRLYGQYLLPGVALDLEDHLERSKGRELPLEWTAFRELAVRRCREANSKLELHSTSERFVKDLLFRLRASPTAHPDVAAYRKAFQNALNLQRVEDVDLFVRTLVAEDRPTDVARFRALLESFRQLKEKIEQVVQRIGAADGVEQQYAKVAAQVTRAASCRALAAEYARDLLAEQVDQAEQSSEQASENFAATRRALQEANLEQQSAEDAHAQANARLQGSQGYGEQAQFDELAGRDRHELARLKKDLLREINFVREQFLAIGKLDLPTVNIAMLGSAQSLWHGWYDTLVALPGDAELPWEAETLHAQAHTALLAAKPLIDAVDGHTRSLHAAFDEAQGRLTAARQNQKRLAAGQAELNPDAVRLMNYLREEGIEAQPVCDLVRVNDVSWQSSIEAYLRSNVEALLIPAADEERATKLYRSLQGGRAVYGVKLALSSQARSSRASERPASDSVAALLDGDNADALAFLRRQLGELRCVETEAELIRSRHGLTRDGLLAKGGSIERLRLPAAADLKIGATDNRARQRVLRDDIEAAERDARTLEPVLRRAEASQRGLARLSHPDEPAQLLHDHVLEHRQVVQRYRAALENRESTLNPDLLRVSEQVRELHERMTEWNRKKEDLIGRKALDEQAERRAQQLLEGLRAQEGAAAQRAVDAFRVADVDNPRVERQREELDAKFPSLEERGKRCIERAAESDERLRKLVPDAWSGLTQYANDYGVIVEFASDQWRPASALLHKELSHLRDTELANYQEQADQAYSTAVETFRANVASTLYDNFSKLKYQINTVNRTLRRSPAFSNNERYQFHYEVAPEYRELHRFIQRVADLGGEDNLFGSAGEVPPAFRELIEDNVASRGSTSPLDDYRRFFRFEVQIRQDERVVGTLSERMRSGSGGEHRAPLYVIAGAALAAAYGKNDAYPGGIGVILLDEFGDKIDAQNARAIVDYLRSLGLQLVLAAPDTAQGTLSGVLESYIEMFRDGDLLQVERIEVKAAARDLLLGDQFDVHPELLAAEAARIAGEQSTL